MAKGRKTGGRQKGTPNKDNPLKGFLREHSFNYFVPKLVETKEGGIVMASEFDLDMAMLEPQERVAAEIRILEFHTPKMKAMEIDMEVNASEQSVAEHLRRLCSGIDDEAEEED